MSSKSYEELLESALSQLPQEVTRQARFELPEPASSVMGSRTILYNIKEIADVVRRLIPYWEDVLVADDLRAGRTVLVAAHGNSLRAMVKHLDDISDTDIAGVNIPTGIPLVYRLDGNLRPVVPGGEYLDPDAAATAAAAVAAQGKA